MKNFKKERAEARKKAKELVSKMTLMEKASQLKYDASPVERLGVPTYNYWNEALHGVARAGVATMFPQAIGMAAVFDDEEMKKVGDIVATEGRAKYNEYVKHEDRDIYKGLTFWSPNVNIFRDPRWGRGQETYGEDPYLTSRLGVRFVEGLQGDDPDYMKAAACAKHFAVHSGPENVRHSFDAKASKQDMYETYLPAFKACVQEAKVEAVMGAYNRTNGEPCCGSKTLLSDILRDEWGFEGHVVSDCWAVMDFHENHRITKSEKESAAMAMNNGCDLNCGCAFRSLRDAVKGGYVEESRLDEAVIRLMETRLKLGMFEEEGKVPFDSISYDRVDTPQNRALNLKIAEKSLVLLKNENGLLPLNPEKIGAIGVIGPNADSRKALVGNYEGTASRYVTVLEGIQDYVGDRVRVFYSEGCPLYGDKSTGLAAAGDRLSEVRAVCEVSDVIVAVMGLDADIEGEQGDAGNEFAGGDKPDLNYPGLQPEVLRIAVESGKPVILVSLTGSAMALSWEDEHIPAILQAWYPGAQGGHAVARVLFGESCPEGKLPVTFYRTAEELPEFTDYSMQGRTYRYMKQDALYPFGYGLSYTRFEQGKAEVSKESIEAGGCVELRVSVKNTGMMAGGQTVQVYVKALREGTPNPQLKGLKKVFLQPGGETQVCISLPDTAFALYDEDGRRMLEAGEYAVYVGMQQPDERSAILMGQRPEKIAITCAQTVQL